MSYMNRKIHIIEKLHIPMDVRIVDFLKVLTHKFEKKVVLLKVSKGH